MSSSMASTSRAEDGATHKSKHNLTPAEKQAQMLEKLMADPSKEVRLPSGPKEKTLRAPREMMKNVSGSSAGAGSGEFHVYKHARRREYERIKLMEDQAAKEKDTSAFMISQAQQAAKDDAKTSKNRAKRDKKKIAKEKAKLASASNQAESNSNASKKRRNEDAQGNGNQVSEKKIKAAPGASGIKFQAKDDDGDDEEDQDASD
ncbi:unnamed protein product [Sympodiomycopsis kandeliae]